MQPEPQPAPRVLPAATAPPAGQPRAGIADITAAASAIALVFGAALLFLSANDVLGQARDVVLAIVRRGVALALILAPFLWRLGRNLAVERAERIRSQERAEMAAHLHDSVLQTLTLMQKRADDPREVSPRSPGARSASCAAGCSTAPPRTDGAASPRRSRRPRPRSRTRTGSRSTSSRSATASSRSATEALVAATREALTNAAKFAGDAGRSPSTRRSARAEPRCSSATAGRGFDPGRVPAGPPRRAGVDHRPDGAQRRDRDGRSAPGAGTEVELRIADAERMTRPSVVIVDDHAIFRSGVRAELEGLVEVLGDAGSVEEAVRMIAEERPDVVLLDVHMPGGGGVEVIRRVAESNPAQRFLALSVSDAAEDVIAVDPRRGARVRDEDDLRSRARRRGCAGSATGDAVFSPRLAGFVLDAFAGQITEAEADPELDQLTTREREVLRLIARGYLYKEIALELSISPKTVEAHVSAVLRKLQLSNRHELSRWAVERRLLD